MGTNKNKSSGGTAVPLKLVKLVITYILFLHICRQLVNGLNVEMLPEILHAVEIEAPVRHSMFNCIIINFINGCLNIGIANVDLQWENYCNIKTHPLLSNFLINFPSSKVSRVNNNFYKIRYTSVLIQKDKYHLINQPILHQPTK